MTTKNTNLFQVWKIYQRRAESIAHYFDITVIYYHYSWEEKSKLLKAISYILKSTRTLIDLIKFRPKKIFIQLPPTPALYLVGIYGLITRTPYVADCHNAMFVGWWIRWPFTKSLLKRASAVLVHSDDVRDYAEKKGIPTIVIKDPLPDTKDIISTKVLDRFDLKAGEYVIVPWNLAPDEPIEEFIEAVRTLSNIKFTMTWFAERLPEKLRADLPKNLLFTGYLAIDEFNDLFANAGAAISLTTREGTQPSAAAEAVAFGIPVILSDTETARLLYRDVPVFVQNQSPSIAQGILEIFRNHSAYCEKIAEFKNIFKRELDQEMELLGAHILKGTSKH